MHFNHILCFVVFLQVVQQIVCECEVSSQTYSTSDGIVISKAAHIITFSVQCKDRPNGLSLFADLNGKTLPAIRSSDGQTYQISWTQELSLCSSATHTIPIYDEEGFGLLRKAQRGGDPQATRVKPLFTLELSHSRPYTGPLIHTEFVATLAAVGVWWGAYTTKNKLIN